MAESGGDQVISAGWEASFSAKLVGKQKYFWPEGPGEMGGTNMNMQLRFWAALVRNREIGGTGGVFDGQFGGRSKERCKRSGLLKWLSRAICALGLVMLAGCTTKSTQTWNSRVGSYTVRQAVKDLGAPNKAQQLGDGTQIGTWMVRAGTRGALIQGRGPTFAARAFDYTVLPRDAPYIPDVNLRLLFGRDGKLIAWDRQYD
jgi:hypothetical protein